MLFASNYVHLARAALTSSVTPAIKQDMRSSSRTSVKIIDIFPRLHLFDLLANGSELGGGGRDVRGLLKQLKEVCWERRSQLRWFPT
jgi:hypothetical protein